MAILRSRLPSLNALHTFEAAARLGNFTSAAGALHVSQAAVSRQIRELETALGKSLFMRLHRGVALTAVGKELAAALTRSFQSIERAVEAARQQHGHVIRVSVEPAFAARWLAPRVPQFLEEHTDIELEIDSTSTLREVGIDVDIAIRYLDQKSQKPGKNGELLVAVNGFPVIAPSLLKKLGPLKSLRALSQAPLLHEDNGLYWQQWFVTAGLKGITPKRQLGLNDQALVLQAAVDGQGVALADDVMAGVDLQAGRLIRLFATEVHYGAYWLVRSTAAGNRAAQRIFCDWLRREVSSRPT